MREHRQGLRAVQRQQFGADGRADDAEQPDRPAPGLRVTAPLRGPRAVQRLDRAERPLCGGEAAGDPPVDGGGGEYGTGATGAAASSSGGRAGRTLKRMPWSEPPFGWRGGVGGGAPRAAGRATSGVGGVAAVPFAAVPFSGLMRLSSRRSGLSGRSIGQGPSARPVSGSAAASDGSDGSQAAEPRRTVAHSRQRFSTSSPPWPS